MEEKKPLKGAEMWSPAGFASFCHCSGQLNLSTSRAGPELPAASVELVDLICSGKTQQNSLRSPRFSLGLTDFPSLLQCVKVAIKDKQVKYFIHYSGWNKK